MFLNNSLKYWEDIYIEGPITVFEFLNEIYNYYQSSLDKNQYEEAFKYYMLRTKEKGFMEEVFHAYLRSAEIAQSDRKSVV